MGQEINMPNTEALNIKGYMGSIFIPQSSVGVPDKLVTSY